MRLIEDQCMSDTILYSPAEHILVQTVKYEVRKRSLQIFILRCVNADDDGLFGFPQIAPRLVTWLKEPVVVQLPQPRKQGAQPAIRVSIGTQNFHEALELRFVGSRFSSGPTSSKLSFMALRIRSAWMSPSSG